MYLIRNRFHSVGEFGGVGDQGSIVTSLHIRPAIVENDIVVAKMSETEVDHLVGCVQEALCVDVASIGYTPVRNAVRGFLMDCWGNRPFQLSASLLACPRVF